MGMSMWDDHDANMLWLDSNFPLDKDPSEPGVNRGPCPEDSGVPADMEATIQTPLWCTPRSEWEPWAPPIQGEMYLPHTSPLTIPLTAPLTSPALEGAWLTVLLCAL